MTAVGRLREAIEAGKDGDPLAPVTVAVPSAIAGLSVRRELAAQPGGLLNVAFMPLARVAELLGAPSLAASGRRPATSALRTELVREVLAARPGLFGDVAAHPDTVSSLESSFADLRSCSEPALDALAGTSARAAEVVRLYRAYRARLSTRWYDERDLFDAAVIAVAQESPALGDVGHLVIYRPRPLKAHEQALVEAFGRRAAVIDADLAPDVTAHQIITATDPDEEVRAVVRHFVSQAQSGTPLHRMALLYPVRQPYALAAHQQLAAAGIPANGPALRTLADTVTGACLLGLLALPDRGFRRDDVAAWLASAPVIDGDGELIHAAAWDRESRRAGVVEGIGQWRSRLAAMATKLAAERDELDAGQEVEGLNGDDEARGRRREGLERRLARVDAMRLFVEELGAVLDPGQRSAWSDFTAWSSDLLVRYLGPEAAHWRWPEEEQEAWRRVADVLAHLGSLDAVSGSVDLSRYRTAVEQALAASASRIGSFGTGVFVGPVSAAWGCEFDVVAVVGLAEGTLPRRVRDDSLLPDRERVAAGDGELALRRQRVEEERTDLRAALAAARHDRVLLWSDADPAGGRTRTPSRFLLEAAARLTGQTTVVSGDLPALARDHETLTTVRSFLDGLRGDPATLADYDLGALLAWTAAGGEALDHWLPAELPRLGAGLSVSRHRDSGDFTRFDGHLGAAMADPFGTDVVLSPTSLERYATCPMRYFLDKALGLEEEERPEEIVRLGAREKGSMVHRTLERYVLERIDGAPASLDRLLALAEEEFAAVEASGITGRPLIWRYDRALVRRELTQVFRRDHLEPLAAELTFGREGHEPITRTIGGRQLTFRGTADRVDDDGRGGLLVTDYKTGSASYYKGIDGDPVDRGRHLQLPLYAMAARARFGPELPARARYWVISEAAGYEEFPVELDDETLERFDEAVAIIVGNIAAGRFPARPGDEAWPRSYQNCRYCDFDRLCQADRARQWERLTQAPELSAYVELAEGERDPEREGEPDE